MGKELDTKIKIIDATIDLIRKEMSIDKITTRRIAKYAGVATSMINYHFQTKDKLIDEAVQKVISSKISKVDNKVNKKELTPVQKLRARIKQAAKFLAENPGISRVSILSDLRNGNEYDNSSQSLQSIFVQLRDIFGKEKDELDLKIMAQQLLAGLQVTFLRSAIFKNQTEIDYYDDYQRDKLIDHFINNILGQEINYSR